jgi:hypothetical protein
VHAKLEHLIEKHIRLYCKPKTMLTDTTAANRIFDLEALCRFNNQRLANFEKLEVAKKRVEQAPPRCKAKMRKLVPKIKPNTDASEKVATALGKGPAFARRLRKLAAYLETRGELPPPTQGQGAHHATLLDNPDVLSAVRVWCTGALDFEEGGFEGKVSLDFRFLAPLYALFQIKPAKLRRYVNEFLLPSLNIEDTISESTAVRWMKKMGFKLSRVRKGIYVDGHERKDVVESRDTFINYLYHSVLPCTFFSVQISFLNRFFLDSAMNMKATRWRKQFHQDSALARSLITAFSTMSVAFMQMINQAMFGCARANSRSKARAAVVLFISLIL